LEFGVLGPVQVVRDGQPLALGGMKQRALLAIFLLNANELLSRDRLIDALWGERAPPTASHTLETYVHRLRRILQAREEVIVTRPGGYLLRLDLDALDLSRFERLLDEGRAGTERDAPERAGAKLREALSLWRGRPLADVEYEPWAAEHVVRLEEMRLDALEERIEADLSAGASRELVGELEALIAAHPLRERPRGQLMRALYRSGRQAEALEVYREGRRVLLDELGIEPGPVLQELERAILVQDSGLGVPSARRAPEWVAAKGWASTTSFIGRKRERREVGRLLRTAQARLVVLTGPGGTGKTRLALELAAELAPRFRHGAVVVDLVPVMDPEAVLPAIAARLGLGESRGRSVLDALAGFLQGRETLLVLDNFEHVHAAAPMLGELLARTDGPTWLVTSRAPLRLSGEHVYLVPPLELPDAAQHLAPDRLKQLEAVRLFVERATRARVDFELSVVNADDVAELCVRLDGLPLALELAAARVRLLSPQAIVGRLGRRLDLLKSEAPDVPERHRTLRAAIEWSYDLLSEAEQTLFACLGVFTGGFTLDGAEAVVTGLGVDALDGVESLLDNNLLRPLATAGGEPRFGMLETIREYASERLDTLADAREVHRRHSLYYLAVAVDAEPQLRGPRQLAWLQRLDADNDNLRAALDWATDNGEVEPGLRGAAGLWRYWQIRSLNGEGRERLERLLALDVENLSPIVLADADAAAGRLAFVLGDYEYARSYLDKGLSVHRDAATTPWASHTAAVLGMIALARGDNDTALRLVEESVAVARSSHDWWAQSQGLGLLGEVLRARNELGRARLAFEESIRAARECGDLRNIGRVLSVLGLVALDQCDHDRANRLFEEGLVVHRDCGDAWQGSRCLANLGLVARDAGDRAEAKRRFAEAVTMQVETNDREGIATTLSLLAELSFADGWTRRAVRVLSAAQMLRDEVGVFPMNQLRRAEVDVEALRARIGEDAFEEAWAGGRSLMLDEAVAYALEDDASAPDPEPAQPVSQRPTQEYGRGHYAVRTDQ
jgi:predicted ATPase/DNA-binding SARP family transcriptional activator/Tfp pilus assembly protein PilF